MADMNSNTLSRYLPQYLSDNEEIACIMEAVNAECELIGAAVTQALDNTYVNYTDEAGGIARWERLFKIAVKEDADMASRVREVRSRLSDRLPYTYNSMDSALTVLYGVNGVALHAVEVDVQAFQVDVWLDLAIEAFMGEITRYVRLRTPANMHVYVGLVFIRHGELTEFTHAALSERTHLHIKRGGR
ncbi:MAG: YmfQ family protein [Oscillospiraceae bacterium]|nr:YmfQ family protein [Oscillospiraceae bacterium]